MENKYVILFVILYSLFILAGFVELQRLQHHADQLELSLDSISAIIYD